MADTRNRTPFYGAVPTSKLQADHIFMADGSTLQEQADKGFELIEEITLTEDTTVIERTTEPDGTAYNFESVIMTFKNVNNNAVTAAGTFEFNNILPIFYCGNFKVNNQTTSYKVVRLLKYANIFNWITNQPSVNFNNGYQAANINPSYLPHENINKIKTTITSDVFETGSVIQIYAIRA